MPHALTVGRTAPVFPTPPYVIYNQPARQGRLLLNSIVSIYPASRAEYTLFNVTGELLGLVRQ